MHSRARERREDLKQVQKLIDSKIAALIERFAVHIKSDQDENITAIKTAMTALDVVIRNPAARRNVGQEEAENATYEEAMAALDSVMQDKARIQREIIALEKAIELAESTEQWDTVDVHDSTALQDMIDASIKNRDSAQTQHLLSRKANLSSQPSFLDPLLKGAGSSERQVTPGIRPYARCHAKSDRA